MSGRWADVLKREFVKEYIVLTAFQKHSHQLKSFEQYGFTAIQNTSFFTDAVQMGLSVRTRQALVDEGISVADDLHEWEDDEWDQFASNCKRPPQIVDPNNDNMLINQAPFLVPVKSLKRFKESSRIAHFNKAVVRPLSWGGST